MQIYILSASGKPLMPTKRKNHIQRLLNRGKAHIVSKKPYTVQLKYETSEVVQDLYGGTDPGRTNIGNAVVTGDGHVIHKEHVTSRNKDIPKLMSERKQHRQMSRRGERLRRKRRARKCRTTTTFPNGRILSGCNKPVMLMDIINTEVRFNNRKRPKGWIIPTVRQCVQTHVNSVKQIHQILPVTDWTIECNKFAFMKMEDNSIRGIDFQNGRLKGFKDANEYVDSLQDGKCTCCGKPIEHYHHIIPRSKGGSDTPENLIGLCKKCHNKVHSGEISLEQQGLKKKYAALSVLNQAIPYIIKELVDIFGEDHLHICMGYETKALRELYKVGKDHPEDAVCIALSHLNVTDITDDTETFEVKQFRRHDRAIIKAQRERTYYLDGKAVCKNKHKRTDQKGDSLEEFAKNNPSDVGRLIVKKSKRLYNRTDRLMPGTEFLYGGERYVLTAQRNLGAVFYANGLPKNGVNAKKCTVIKQNKGLVYI